MENHGTRHEVMRAFSGVVGSETRSGNTIGVKFLYVAVPVAEGALRIAVPLHEVDRRRGIAQQAVNGNGFGVCPRCACCCVFAR
jgi:hypothetical protein